MKIVIFLNIAKIKSANISVIRVIRVQRDLVAKEHQTSSPLFHYFSMNHSSHNEVNKGIREKDHLDCLATKGTIKNKGLKEKGTNIFSSF